MYIRSKTCVRVETAKLLHVQKILAKSSSTCKQLLHRSTVQGVTSIWLANYSHSVPFGFPLHMRSKDYPFKQEK